MKIDDIYSKIHGWKNCQIYGTGLLTPILIRCTTKVLCQQFQSHAWYRSQLQSDAWHVFLAANFGPMHGTVFLAANFSQMHGTGCLPPTSVRCTARVPCRQLQPDAWHVFLVANFSQMHGTGCLPPISVRCMARVPYAKLSIFEERINGARSHKGWEPLL
jgi:hypothetical protein